MSRDYMGKAEFEDEARAAGKDETPRCPICDEPFKADDNCATDIELGTCHFDCLDGSPVVDLETGEEIADDDMHSFPYSEVTAPPPPQNLRGRFWYGTQPELLDQPALWMDDPAGGDPIIIATFKRIYKPELLSKLATASEAPTE